MSLTKDLVRENALLRKKLSLAHIAQIRARDVWAEIQFYEVFGQLQGSAIRTKMRRLADQLDKALYEATL